MSKLPFGILVVLFSGFAMPTQAVPLSEARCYVPGSAAFQFGLPDSLSIDSVYKAVGARSKLCGIAAKKWPYQKDAYAIHAEDTAFDHLILAGRTGKSLWVMARYKQPRTEDLQFSDFDFAKYQLNNKSTALGIRYKSTGSCMNGWSERNHLQLLEPKADSLREVLFTTMGLTFEITSAAMDDGSRYLYGTSQTGVLIVGKPDKSGYNRLVKKVNGVDSPGAGQEDLKLPTESETYTWETDRYIIGSDSVFHSCD